MWNKETHKDLWKVKITISTNISGRHCICTLTMSKSPVVWAYCFYDKYFKFVSNFKLSKMTNIETAMYHIHILLSLSASGVVSTQWVRAKVYCLSPIWRLEPALTDLNKTLCVTKMQFIVIGKNWIKIIDNTATNPTVTPVLIIHKTLRSRHTWNHFILIENIVWSWSHFPRYGWIQSQWDKYRQHNQREMTFLQVTKCLETFLGSQSFAMLSSGKDYRLSAAGWHIVNHVASRDMPSHICIHFYQWRHTFLLINHMRFWQGLCIFQHKPCVTVNKFTPGWCGITFRSEISEHMLHTLNISELVKLLFDALMISQHWFR